MAEPNDYVSDRVAKRVELMNGELAEIIALIGAQDDPNVGLKALLNAHKLAISTLTELVGMLAAEIDVLRRQSAPPR